MGVEPYYHGGVRGLRVGDYVLPPAETGTENTLQKYTRDEPWVPEGHQREDRVYLVKEKRLARAYAAIYPNGDVYEVEPEGGVEPDPDAPEISFQAPRARVVKVLERRITRTFHWGFKQISGTDLRVYARQTGRWWIR